MKTPQRRSVRIAARVVLFVATWAVLFVAVDKLLLPLYTRHFSERMIPKLTGLALFDAIVSAERNGFSCVREKARPDSKYAPETVVEQSPRGGTNAKLGRVIYVTVASHVKQVATPNLFEMSPREAALRVEENGLKLIENSLEFEYSDLVAAGFIMRQNPPAGMPVKPGTEVHIYLSKGPEPGKSSVPELLGLSVEQARKLIKQSGLVMGDPVYERSLNLSEGRILRQQPLPGVVVENGTTIELVVSSGK